MNDLIFNLRLISSVLKYISFNSDTNKMHHSHYHYDNRYERRAEILTTDELAEEDEGGAGV